jgi:hypothetical protein
VRQRQLDGAQRQPPRLEALRATADVEREVDVGDLEQRAFDVDARLDVLVLEREQRPPRLEAKMKAELLGRTERRRGRVVGCAAPCRVARECRHGGQTVARRHRGARYYKVGSFLRELSRRRDIGLTAEVQSPMWAENRRVKPSEDSMVRKVGGGGTSGIDPRAVAELQELEEELARQAAQSLAPASAQAPQVSTPKKVDRAGARGVLSQNTPRVELQAAPQMDPVEKELMEKLQALGYLPKGENVSRAQLEQATQKFINEHRNDLLGVNSIDDLFALLDMLMARENGRRNSAPQWSGRSPANRPGSLPPAQTYRNQGPSPNQGALQQQATQAISQNPPPAGSVNARVAEAARNYMGTSTAAGPDGGNLACAWSVNNILSNAGLQKVGSNPNYVPSVEQDLNGRRGTRIDPSQARPGDIVIWPNGHHIGIYMGDGKVANNSSSRAAFVNMSSMQSGMRVYRLNS